MMQFQVPTLVGGHSLVDPDMEDSTNLGSKGKTALSKTTFSATKDIDSLRTAIKSINYVLGGYYTDDNLDRMTKNDLLFVISQNQDAIDGAAITVAAWAAATAYVVGQKVTVTGGTLQVRTAGTSGAAAPANPAAVGGTVQDGTVFWVRIS